MARRKTARRKRFVLEEFLKRHREGELLEYTEKYLDVASGEELLTGERAIDALYDECRENLKGGVDTKEVVDALANLVRKSQIVVLRRSGNLYPTRITKVLGGEQK